jgi:hypothetical protein
MVHNLDVEMNLQVRPMLYSRSRQVSLDEAEHFLHNMRRQRRYAPMVFGIIPDLAFAFAGIPKSGPSPSHR